MSCAECEKLAARLADEKSKRAGLPVCEGHRDGDLDKPSYDGLDCIHCRVAYLEAQETLLQEWQDRAKAAEERADEVTRPLDAQMARLNERVVELNGENHRLLRALGRLEPYAVAADDALGSLQEMLAKQLICTDDVVICAACGGGGNPNVPHEDDCPVERGLEIIEAVRAKNPGAVVVSSQGSATATVASTVATGTVCGTSLEIREVNDYPEGQMPNAGSTVPSEIAVAPGSRPEGGGVAQGVTAGRDPHFHQVCKGPWKFTISTPERRCLELLMRGEITASKAAEWMRAYLNEGRIDPLPDDEDRGRPVPPHRSGGGIYTGQPHPDFPAINSHASDEGHQP